MMRSSPIEERPGRWNQMLKVSASAPATKIPGTQGYPQQRYGRGKSGSVRRKRKSETTAVP